MILKVFATILLLASCAYAGVKPDRSKLTRKADGVVIKRCTKECEAITVDHFKEVYVVLSVVRKQKKDKES